jgi:hypothetical protein
MSARLIQVIETDLERRGNGKTTPIRIIKQYYSVDGELLAEVDPSPDACHSTEVSYLREVLRRTLKFYTDIDPTKNNVNDFFDEAATALRDHIE